MYHLSTLGDWAILEITKASIDDEAEYMCICTNALGECKTSSELLVNEDRSASPPKRVLKTKEKVVVYKDLFLSFVLFIF